MNLPGLEFKPPADAPRIALNPNLPCPNRCTGGQGFIVLVGGQNTVRCAECGAKTGWNAPPFKVEGRKPTPQELRDGVSPERRMWLLDRDGHRCVDCGRRAPDVELELGHIVSVADAVRHNVPEDIVSDYGNLAVMCKECNTGRGDRSVPGHVAWAIELTRIRRAQNQHAARFGSGPVPPKDGK